MFVPVEKQGLFYLKGEKKMLDIKFVRNNPDLVRENIKKKFQDHKLPLVDEVIELDTKIRNIKFIGDDLRAKRNAASSQIGALMREKKADEAMKIKESVLEINAKFEKIDFLFLFK